MHLLSPGSGFQLLWVRVTVLLSSYHSERPPIIMIMVLVISPKHLVVRRIDGLQEAIIFMFCVNCQSPALCYSQKYAAKFHSDLLLAC